MERHHAIGAASVVVAIDAGDVDLVRRPLDHT
jgi:hypothetical protein